ncbi:MAG: DNA replication/repair protein RecF [Alphaproteobacteria bacterium]
MGIQIGYLDKILEIYPITIYFMGMENICYLIKQIDLTNYRNYPMLRFVPSDGMNILLGANGAGKTNLIEAISILIPGRGLRMAGKEDFAKYDISAGQSWAVVAQIDDSQQYVKLATGAPKEATRDVLVNGEKSRQSDLSRFFNCVWLTPNQDRLFVDGASARRRFLDRLVFGMDPAHAGRINAYEKSMRERAKLLALGNSDAAWLDAIEDNMVSKGIAIAAARFDVVSRLSKYTQARQGLFPQASLSLEGEVDEWLGELNAIDGEDRYRKALKDNRQKDTMAAMTHIGPHRSDLMVFHSDKKLPAKLCSTGEQKALLVSIILADSRMQGAERGIKPVLLLDEITAHLDPMRRQSLFDELEALGVQAFLTGTEIALFDSMQKRAKIWQVSTGQISEY